MGLCSPSGMNGDFSGMDRNDVRYGSGRCEVWRFCRTPVRLELFLIFNFFYKVRTFV